jgi:hypothetical protein
MSAEPPIDAIEADIWAWMRDFVAVRNEFYDGKFAPCPFAQRALTTQTVDVAVWRSGNIREFARERALEMRDSAALTTRVMVFPPRTQLAWGFGDFVEALNAELIPDDVFLNTGMAKTTTSRYSGSGNRPYFIVVANRLDAVLKGSESLQRSAFYENWPAAHRQIVVERRQRMASRYGKKGGTASAGQ